MCDTNDSISTRLQRRWSARALVVVINGMLAGVGAVFLATGSVPATVIAATAAVAIAAVIVVANR